MNGANVFFGFRTDGTKSVREDNGRGKGGKKTRMASRFVAFIIC